MNLRSVPSVNACIVSEQDKNRQRHLPLGIFDLTGAVTVRQVGIDSPLPAGQLPL